MSVQRIALIDDNNIFCFIFEKLVEKYEGGKINVLRFDNGKTALEYFLENKDNTEYLPTIAFVDINMPILNGWGFLDALVANQHPLINTIPFFIVSSSDNSIDINKSKEYSFIKEYLHKPLDKNKLYAILNQHLSI